MIKWLADWFRPEWLGPSGITMDQVVAGSNAIPQAGSTLILVLLVAAAYQTRMRIGRGAIIQAAGAALIAFGWIAHRGYWNLTLFQKYDQADYAAWAMDYRLFPATQTVVIMAGTLMVLSRFGHIYLGAAKWWALVLASYASWVGYSVYLAS